MVWAANLAAIELHAPMALADDLDTPSALAAVDAVVASGAKTSNEDLAAIDALLGIDLSDNG